MKQSLLFLFTLIVLQATAQIKQESLVGDWKLYLKDKTSFEFLRLNADGTGLKCFGQTINGKDTLFLNHITTLLITKWKAGKGKLIIESKNNLSFKINPEYKFTLLDSDKMKLEGENLIFYLYPSVLNKKEFQRSVIYERANKIPKGYGVNTLTCITLERSLFLFRPIDTTMQFADYKGFDDLIPHIVSCNDGFEYVQKYRDPPYSLMIPASINKWSFGFGNKMFYISFDSDDRDTSETSIVIYYDFDNEMKDYYFSQIGKGAEKKDIVRVNDMDIYKTINWQGKYEGKIFLKNFIVVAYYTKNKKLRETLQKSITSFKYK
jgi:hypothetical protein